MKLVKVLQRQQKMAAILKAIVDHMEIMRTRQQPTANEDLDKITEDSYENSSQGSNSLGGGRNGSALERKTDYNLLGSFDRAADKESMQGRNKL